MPVGCKDTVAWCPSLDFAKHLQDRAETQEEGYKLKVEVEYQVRRLDTQINIYQNQIDDYGETIKALDALHDAVIGVSAEVYCNWKRAKPMRNRSRDSRDGRATGTPKSDRWLQHSVWLIAVVLLLSTSLFAQVSTNALSKEKLVALKSAGISDSILIQQIQKDGISFDMDADTTLELKKAGFSNEVLQTLLKAASKPSAISTPAAESDPIRALYEQKKYAELADYVKARLDRNSDDGRSRVILIVSLLKLRNNDAGLAEFARLKANSHDSFAPKYALQVQSVLDV
jgi:hypothetical protein